MRYLNKYDNFLILEASKSISDLVEQGNFCLFISESENKVEFIIYQSTELKLVGTIRIVKDDKSGTPNPYNSFSVNKSAVNKTDFKGYGPTLYDIVLQYCGSVGLRPDRSVSPEAKAIWKYYFDNRKDISKKPIDNFRNPLTQSKEDDGKLASPFSLSDPNQYPKTIDDNSFMNQVYFYSGQKQYTPLLKNHEEQVRIKGKEIEDNLQEQMNQLFTKLIK